jgi:hypothetical protein
MTMRTVLVAAALLIGVPALAQDDPQPPKNPPAAVKPAADQGELEKQFEKTLTGAALVGRFTLEGPDGKGDRQPKEERYHINKVTKMRGDYWLFAARVQYGNKDVTVPMMLQVKWAGDTPVITLTDLTIPGLGTYTARVMIFRDHYAGYWSGGDHGGNLWGRIERKAEGADEPADAPRQPKAPVAPAEPDEPDEPAKPK